MFTLATVARDAAEDCGEDYGTDAVQSLFIRWTNHGIASILNECDWPFRQVADQITTAAGVGTYPVAANQGEIQGIVLSTSNLPLTEYNRHQLIRDGRDLEQSGTPTRWMYDGINADSRPLIRLWPAPSASDLVYDVYSNRNYEKLTHSDTVPLPDEFEVALYHYLKTQYFLTPTNKDVELAAGARTTYDAELARLRSRYLASPASVFRQAPVQEWPGMGPNVAETFTVSS